MSEDKCVCCGDVIPEGRQVCPKCEKAPPAEVEAARNEAIRKTVKEFADRVKAELYYQFDELIPSIIYDRIDEIAKEMAGDDYGSK